MDKNKVKYLTRGLGYLIILCVAVTFIISVTPLLMSDDYVKPDMQEDKAYLSSDYILKCSGPANTLKPPLPNVEYIIMSEVEHNAITWARAQELLEFHGYELIILDHTGLAGYYIGTFHRKG